MKNEIISFDKKKPLNENIKSLVITELKLLNQLKKIEKIKEIYEDEYEEIKSNIHTTGTGEIMLISEMEDSHLINTITLFSKKHGLSGRNKKYVEEAKKRGLVNELIDIQTEEEEDELPINRLYIDNPF